MLRTPKHRRHSLPDVFNTDVEEMRDDITLTSHISPKEEDEAVDAKSKQATDLVIRLGVDQVVKHRREEIELERCMSALNKVLAVTDRQRNISMDNKNG